MVMKEFSFDELFNNSSNENVDRIQGFYKDTKIKSDFIISYNL